MKRIITAVAVIFTMAATSFSQTVEKTDNELWLDKYEALVTSMQAFDPETVPADSIASWKEQRADIRKEYKDVYKDFLSDEETKRYFSLCAQYSKQQAKFKFTDVGNELNEVGGKVKDKAKKVGKKVGNKLSGIFEGLKK